MFDNFGLGEFMTIAIFALLFFGPERLPQMGAKLGQWLGKLTQQSKVFMYQWREEALAIHGAVEEVKGIRDEIMAAQREITGTVTSAQGDIAQSLDDVKGTLKNSQVTYEKIVKEAEAEERTKQSVGGAIRTGSEIEAIEKSQAILAGMQAKLGDVSLESGRTQAFESTKDGLAASLADEALSEAGPAEPADATAIDVQEQLPTPSAHDQTRQILDAMQRKLSGEPVEEETPAAQETTVTDTVELDQAAGNLVQPAGKEIASLQDVQQRIPGSRVLGEKIEKRTGPSAQERTQSILDRMQRKLAGDPVEDLEALIVPEEKTGGQASQDEWSRNHDLIQSALSSSGPTKQPVKQEPEAELPAALVGQQAQQVVPANGTSEKIRELSDQVSSLQSELKSLHQALDALRAEMLIKTALPAPQVPAGVASAGVTSAGATEESV